MKINTEIEFAASILVGSENYGRTCINGLPLTPSSIRLLGRFKHLLELKHEHLCTYIELIRAQNAANACFVVSEHYVKVLDCKTLSKKDLETVILQLMSATSYCHDEDVVIGHLTTGNILITHSCDGVCVKLSQYGLNHISGNGVDVDYLIADFYYLSPERVAKLGISTSKSPASKKSDSWAIGIIMVELYLKITLSDLWSIQQFISILQSFCHKMNTQTDSFLSHLLEAIKIANSEIDINIDENVKILIEKCLQLSSLKRSSIKEAWGFAKEVYKFQESTVKEGEFDKHMQMIEKLLSDANLEGVIVDRPLNELFFLWKLCGSNIEAILKPAEHKFARCVIDDFILLGDVLENDCLNSYDAILLPSSNLKSRLKALQYQNTYFDDGTDLVETPNKFVHNLGQTLIVKERDIDYQAYRMRLMKDLLDAFPYSSHMLKTECKKDIPPVYRGALWSALLNVNDSVYIDFKQLNTYAEHPADRQLQVDIPRCHQYEELMTSPAAHMKLKRLLKAWLLANPDYVYWQGLDSLAAPFLVHHFNDLPRAYGCLQNFISRYLKDFFLKDNALVIKEYLAVFTQLLSFLDSELFEHLHEMDFCAELFAIPWFLTCFAHVLPLHKLFHLWDALLLTDSSFTLFIGIAILIQMRKQLLSSHFNEAILLFSDLPDLSIDAIVADSLCYYHSVPPSCTHRIYSSTHTRPHATPLTNISFDELSSLHSVRISPTDLMELTDHNRVIILDIRATYEFNRLTIPFSINLPQNTNDFTSKNVITLLLKKLKEAIDGKQIICIIDSTLSNTSKLLSNELIKQKVNFVCILDNSDVFLHEISMKNYG